MQLPRKSVAVGIVLLALLSSACVKQNEPGVGLVKFDSSAIFGIDTEEDAVVPDFSVPDGFVANDVNVATPVRRVLEAPPPGPCPAAKLNAFPKAPATVQVLGKPSEGLYKWQRDVLRIKDARATPPVQYSAPFALESRGIRTVIQESDHQFSFEMMAPSATEPKNTVITSFRVNTNPALIVNQYVEPRTIGVVDVPGATVRTADPGDAPGIFITGVQTVDAGGKQVSDFSPVQPMLVLPLNEGIVRSGETFQSVGIDATTGTVWSNDGRVGRTSRVDACGEIVEGYTVSLRQTLTSDAASDASSAASEAVARQQTREQTYTFATQYGALPIAETVAIGDFNLDAKAFQGSWELGALTPAPLPASAK